MKVTIEYVRLKLKVSYEPEQKPVYVKGYFRMVNGHRIYVRPHYRKR